MKHKVIMLISLLCSACAQMSVTSAIRIDNIPMYGQPEVERPEVLKQADDDFIASVSKRFDSREIASKIWAQQADRFMNEGNLDFAMRRYNQSWLLDPENYAPYWGFARVLLERGQIDEALGFLQVAHDLIDDPYQEVALLADTGSAWTIKATMDEQHRETHFEKANALFTESAKMDPEYGDVWRRWAFSLYEQARYEEAVEKMRRANEFGAKPFPKKFIEALQEKHPFQNSEEEISLLKLHR